MVLSSTVKDRIQEHAACFQYQINTFSEQLTDSLADSFNRLQEQCLKRSSKKHMIHQNSAIQWDDLKTSLKESFHPETRRWTILGLGLITVGSLLAFSLTWSHLVEGISQLTGNTPATHLSLGKKHSTEQKAISNQELANIIYETRNTLSAHAGDSLNHEEELALLSTAESFAQSGGKRTTVSPAANSSSTASPQTTVASATPSTSSTFIEVAAEANRSDPFSPLVSDISSSGGMFSAPTFSTNGFSGLGPNEAAPPIQIDPLDSLEYTGFVNDKNPKDRVVILRVQDPIKGTTTLVKRIGEAFGVDGNRVILKSASKTQVTLLLGGKTRIKVLNPYVDAFEKKEKALAQATESSPSTIYDQTGKAPSSNPTAQSLGLSPLPTLPSANTLNQFKK